jgi:integrase
MLHLELELALRREDAAEVRIENIDLSNSKLKFVEKKKHVRKDGKDIGSRVRVVYIGPRLKQTIEKYLNATGRKKGKLFNCTGRTLFNWLQEMCDRAGIPRRAYHAFRSTSIKRHLRAGWSIAAVCAYTFDSPAVIEKHYLVPSDDEMRELSQEKEVLSIGA